MDVDVVVVGAGISGLIAARTIRRAGLSVAVVEARDRVGGKMHTVALDGCAVDLGAHWIGPTQRRFLALVDELGVESEPQYLAGKHSLTLDGRRRTFTGSTPFVSPLGAAETAWRVARVELRRRTIDVEAPWRSRGARRLDATTLADWMHGMRSSVTRATFRIAARTIFGAEPSELSLLFFLWYVNAAGGFQALTEFQGGAQDSRLRGGAQQVCDRIAGELGAAVTLGSPVTSIDRRGGQAIVVEAAGRRFSGRRAICALAPPLLDEIAFDPPLPAPRSALARRTTMGAYMKAVAVYDHAWWRDRGLSGIAFAGEGPVQMVVDDSPRGGRPGVLVGFVTGAPARELQQRGGAERRALTTAAIGRALADDAPRPAAYRDLNWLDERWSRGAPVSLMGPGTLTSLGAVLRPPVGLLHWAGTDTATEWNGYVDGAIQAGERAAREVIRALT